MRTRFTLLVLLCMCFIIHVEAQDQNKMIQAILGSKKVDASKLPDAYLFDWEFKTEIKTAKKESMEMNYLINSSSKDYFGMEMSSKELKGKAQCL